MCRLKNYIAVNKLKKPPEKLGGGVWPASQNPHPIYD